MMKKTLYLLTLLLALVGGAACQDESATEAMGYLRVDLDTNSLTNIRAVADDYNAKRLKVQIVSETGDVMAQTENYEEWGAAKTFLLPIGTYTISASSYGFDGSESGFDLPYYTGSTTVVVKKDTEVTAPLTCTLANVKVTVNFDTTFKTAFAAATTTVTSALEGVAAQSFVMNSTTRPAYFPVGNLTAKLSVTNKSGATFTHEYAITDVAARDHYILNYRVAELGSSSIDIVVDGTEKNYNFAFPVATTASTTLAMDKVNPWATVAYLEGSIASIEAGKTLDDDAMKFEYRKRTDTEWTAVPALRSGATYRATLTGLQPEATYVSRLTYVKSADAFFSDEMSFATEAVPSLVNGAMDDWYKSGKTWYACSSDYYAAHGGSFWDSSNPATTTGAGAMVNVNPTTGTSSVTHTPGGQAAYLQSQYASAFGIGKFAAASLYVGQFVELVGTSGAKIKFGQPFTARPTQLHGFLQYATGVIDYLGANTPASAGLVKGESTDVCSIYVALTSQQYQIDNTDASTFVDWANDPSIIAYGELPLSESGATGGEWREFTIDFKYRDLTRKPSYLVIVCSSSRYGDYFTGSTSSAMCIDDMELLYGTPVTE